MRDWRVAAGVGLGLIAAAYLIHAIEGPPRRRELLPHRGSLLSDCDGTLREFVIHYVPEANRIVVPVYRDFLAYLEPAVTVHVVCPEQTAFDDLCRQMPPIRCRLSPVITGHPITCWSRDRWLALPAAEPGGPTCLLTSIEETGAHAWPARRGDQLVARDMAIAMAGQVITRRGHLWFDGGDFVCDGDTAFVTPNVIQRNVGRSVPSTSALKRELGRLLKREIVLLGDAPPHHAGMFMMPVGAKRVLVGDPSMAALLLSGVDPAGLHFPEPDFSQATAQRFDAVAAACAAAGYEVTRVPVLPGVDGRTYWTYLNVVIDARSGQRVVYMPVYRTADVVNEAATSVWHELGYEVRPVDCTSAFRHGGSLRCLVNVLARGADAQLARSPTCRLAGGVDP